MKTFDLGAVTAYALAVKNGFKGTEQEWLTSLVPNLSIGEVKTLDAGSNAAAVMGGTPENPVLNLSLPCGENGHAADWNQNDPAQPDYVQNRTHYESEDGVVPLPAKFLPNGVPYLLEGELVEILPDFTITSEPDMMEIPALGLVEGNAYIVTVNGVEYPCVAWKYIMDGVTCVGLGDLYTATEGQGGTAVTGEPFVLWELPPKTAADLRLNVFVRPLSDDITMPVTFSVKGENVAIHKLDNRCLDLAWLPVNSYEPIIEQKTLIFDDMESDGVYITEIDLVPLADGQRVRVDFDGVRYNLVVVADGNGYFFVGNGALVNFGSDTGEPFALEFNPSNSLAIVHACKQGACDFAMYNLEPNKMPKEFLPTDVAELYLTSSGGKKFKITITDDGALSAAEVVD